MACMNPDGRAMARVVNCRGISRSIFDTGLAVR